MWEERDRPVPAATVRTWPACCEPIPARERKRPGTVVGIAVATPPRREPNRRRISRAGRDLDHVLGQRGSRSWPDQVAARHGGRRRDIACHDRRSGRERDLGSATGRKRLRRLDDPKPAACVGQPRHDLGRLAASADRDLGDPSRTFDAMTEDQRRRPHGPDQLPRAHCAVRAQMLRFDDPGSRCRSGRAERVRIDRESPVGRLGHRGGSLQDIAGLRSNEDRSRKSRGAHNEIDGVDNCPGRVHAT